MWTASAAGAATAAATTITAFQCFLILTAL